MTENETSQSSHFSRLSDQQVGMIHDASLEILESIGVRLYFPEAIELLLAAGSEVSDGNLVRIPHHLVEWALTTVSQSLILHDRYGNPTMPLENRKCYYGPGSDCLNIIDHRTGERRKPVLQDVIEGTRLCDALPNIDFVMSMVLPVDVEQTIADTYQMEAMLCNTPKPIIYVSYEIDGLINAVKMAEAVVGGADTLRKKPILACYINVVSGATHNEVSLQKLLYLAEKGLPVLYIPGSNAGVTSPMTMAGAVALDLAGGLTGLVLSQLKREGAPFIMSGMDPAALDMHTMVSPYAYPERGFIRSMARYYQLPAFELAGGSDAKMVDQQAAAEAALTMLADTLMGGNIIHDLGYLESGLTFSLAQLAICDQIVSWIKAFTKELVVSPETLALEVIRGMSPEGQYLKSAHTRKHFKDHWYPDLFERGTYLDWTHKGSQSLGERASARVQKLLEEWHLANRTEPLPEEIRIKLRSIVQRAEAR